MNNRRHPKFDQTRVKLGKGPKVVDPNEPQFDKYAVGTAAKPAVDYTKGITSWGMMLNDQLGDCTIAGCGHAIQVWSANVGTETTLPDSAILQKYEQWAGYVPGNPATDQGAIETSILNQWRASKNGFWNNKLVTYANVGPQNLTHVCQAIEYFGGVYIGLQLPVSAQNQLTWDVSTGPNAIPGSWGGHCVYVPKYRTDATTGKLIFTCITWGELIDITEDFWMYVDPNQGPYVEEVHALLSYDWVGTGRVTPEGFDLAQLETDLQSVEN